MNSGLGVGLKEVVEVVGGDGLLQLAVDLRRVWTVGLNEFLFFVFRFDVTFAFVPGKKMLMLMINEMDFESHINTWKLFNSNI